MNSNLLMILLVTIMISLTVQLQQQQIALGQLLEIPNADEARRITEVDLPVWNQPPAVDFNKFTPDRPNSTNIEAIDWRTNETLGLLYVWDAQYQNETVALAVPEYFNCVVASNTDLYEQQGIAFKNESKAEYIASLEQCIAIQWIKSNLVNQLMEVSPMERALMGFQ